MPRPKVDSQHPKQEPLAFFRGHRTLVHTVENKRFHAFVIRVVSTTMLEHVHKVLDLDKIFLDRDGATMCLVLESSLGVE